MSIPSESVQSLIEFGNKITNALLLEANYPCSAFRKEVDKGKSCILLAEEFPLTQTEKAMGWAIRPFWAYNQQNMCLACRAFWYASNMANTLYELKHYYM